jgi:hypothetical protein
MAGAAKCFWGEDYDGGDVVFMLAGRPNVIGDLVFVWMCNLL